MKWNLHVSILISCIIIQQVATKDEVTPSPLPYNRPTTGLSAWRTKWLGADTISNRDCSKEHDSAKLLDDNDSIIHQQPTRPHSDESPNPSPSPKHNPNLGMPSRGTTQITKSEVLNTSIDKRVLSDEKSHQRFIASSGQKPKKYYKIYKKVSKKSLASKEVDRDDTDTSSEIDDSDDASDNASQSFSTSAIGQVGSAIGATAATSSSTKQVITRLLNFSLNIANVALWYFIAKSLWSATKEVLDEIAESEAASSSYLGSSINTSSGIKEDHDLPFINQDEVDIITKDMLNDSTGSDQVDSGITSLNSEGENTDQQQPPNSEKERNVVPKESNLKTTSKANKTHKTLTLETRQKPNSVMSNLALRLHASGLPILPLGSSRKNVETVLKSLTRTEGKLLNNILLSPLDTQEHGVILGSSTRDERITAMWNEIGGLEDVKEALLDLVFPMLFSQQQQELQLHEDPIDNTDGHHDVFSDENTNYGGLLSNPPGVLLYGPPGCGKTMLVRALAHTAKARFLCVTPSTLLRKYVGETNLNVKALFSLARKVSPCIIFIDEMEGLFKERSSGGGTGDELLTEVKTEFMQLWDGIHSKGLEEDQVLVIGATNRPFDVDSAFLRRMPRSFYVGLPDHASRVAILNSMLSNVPLSPDFDVDLVASITENYSPSDLKEVLRTAALNPMREARRLAVQQQLAGAGSRLNLRPLLTSDVLEAKHKVAPTQFTPNYCAALADYANRASGGRAQLDGLRIDGGSTQQYSTLSQQQPNNSFGFGQVFYSDFHSTPMPNEYDDSHHSPDSFQEHDDYDESSSFDE